MTKACSIGNTTSHSQMSVTMSTKFPANTMLVMPWANELGYRDCKGPNE